MDEFFAGDDVVGLDEGEFESVDAEIEDGGFFAREEEPAVVCAVGTGVVAQDFGGVFFIGGDGEKADVGKVARGVVDLGEALGEVEAGAGAGGEEEVGDPHFPAHGGGVERLAATFGESEVRELEEGFERGGRGLLIARDDECGGEE